jgi:AraC-like DNA-binding protein
MSRLCTVLVRGGSDEETAALRLRFRGWKVDRYLSDQSFLDAIRSSADVILVRELSARVGWSPLLLSEFLSAAGDAPVIIRTELRPGFVREALSLIAGLPNVRLSLVGYDSLATELAAVQSRPDEICADRPILSKVTGRLNPRIREVVVGAVAGSKRRIDVSNLARLCGQSIRTLQWGMQKARAPTPECVLGWATSLHILWRLETTQTAVKLAARDAGFADASAFGNYMFRHAGVRPAAAIREVGFATLLERFASQFG